jgi:hypothetical protein
MIMPSGAHTPYAFVTEYPQFENTFPIAPPIPLNTSSTKVRIPDMIPPKNFMTRSQILLKILDPDIVELLDVVKAVTCVDTKPINAILIDIIAYLLSFFPYC